ncbi:hypothetical protein SLS55_000561 [Diplodia seriata]|uniref:Uncharacterized protein n=1 Tax=Diplodia seriata TaxID=420778 RepID=A0ABR3CUN5_9PEZI
MRNCPAEQRQRMKTTKKFLQRLKKHFVPIASSTDSDKKQPVEDNQGLTQQIADLAAAQKRINQRLEKTNQRLGQINQRLQESNQRQEESNQRQEQINQRLQESNQRQEESNKYLERLNKYQHLGNAMWILQETREDQQEKNQVLTQQFQESRAAHEQTNKEIKEHVTQLGTELNQKLGYLQEAVKGVERGVSKDQADIMIEIANAEAELAQENAAKEAELTKKLAQEKAVKEEELAKRLAQETAAEEEELLKKLEERAKENAAKEKMMFEELLQLIEGGPFGLVTKS